MLIEISGQESLVPFKMKSIQDFIIKKELMYDIPLLYNILSFYINYHKNEETQNLRVLR